MGEKATVPVVDWELHGKNRAKFTLDDMRPYAGQLVSWSLEGDRIVAHSADPDELVRQLKHLGRTGEDVLTEQVPPIDRFEELF